MKAERKRKKKKEEARSKKKKRKRKGVLWFCGRRRRWSALEHEQREHGIT